MIFPLAYLTLTSSLTVLLIMVGVSGHAQLAAELAVIQGAVLATFYAFSANARNLILQRHGDLTPERLLAKRIVTLPLLCIVSYLLCVAAGVSSVLAVLIIARRACEWAAEVRLCDFEIAGQARPARRAFVIQATVTVVAAAVLVFARGFTVPALVVYAVSPLLVSMPQPKRAAFRPEALYLTLRSIPPYIGSTAVEGISTYVLRLIVFLVAGPERSGLLFTAFVLGSFAATLFANVFGQTLALRRARDADARHSRAVALAALGMGAAGIAVSAASLATGLADWFGRAGYFWLALGLSLVGGTVMIWAQTIRLRLFDEQRGEALFGPDVLRNIATIIAAPALYYLVGPATLSGLYLGTALLTAFFYRGAEWHELHETSAGSPALVWGAIAAAIVLPLFFMLNGHVYRSPHAPLLDPGGNAVNVPLPLSLGACFGGVLLLARYRQAMAMLGTIFFLFIAMVLTTVIAAQGHIGDELRKFVLLFQFLVPAFALVLGQMFGRAGLRMAAIGFSVVLTILVPAQLLNSIGYGENQLYHDLWLFSVYQHLQYVPAVVMCAYLAALFILWDDRVARWVHVALAPLVAYYVASSYSTLAVVLAVMGAAVLPLAVRRDKTAWLCAVLLVATMSAYFYVNRHASPIQQKFGRSASATEWRLEQTPSAGVPPPLAEALPGPMQTRLYYWKLYGAGIVESARTILFGHPRLLDRSVAPSAHNYYLDFVYNFGVVAFLPFAWLVAYTLALLWRARVAVWRDLPLLGLALGVIFMLTLDNMFKVPLRQPYSGIFYFFIWGLFISTLRNRQR